MKKNILLVAIAVLLFSIPALAQRSTRISFKRGATSAVITGKLNSYAGRRVYLIRVRDGQTLTTQDIGTRPVSIFIEGPAGYVQDLAANCNSNNEVPGTIAGDYKLTVQECQKADRWRGTFRVRVTVR